MNLGFQQGIRLGGQAVVLWSFILMRTLPAPGTPTPTAPEPVTAP